MNEGPLCAAWFAPIADQYGKVRTHSWVISKITVSQEANLAFDVDDVHVSHLAEYLAFLLSQILRVQPPEPRAGGLVLHVQYDVAAMASGFILHAHDRFAAGAFEQRFIRTDPATDDAAQAGGEHLEIIHRDNGAAANEFRIRQAEVPRHAADGERQNVAELVCNLALSDFRDADLRCANLKGANLRGARFTNALLTQADLTNADLAPMKLSDRSGWATGDDVPTDLSNAHLNDANLSNANLTQANLCGSSLKEF